MGGNTPSVGFDENLLKENGLKHYQKITAQDHPVLGEILIYRDNSTLEKWLVAKNFVTQDSDLATLIHSELGRFQRTEKIESTCHLKAYSCIQKCDSRQTRDESLYCHARLEHGIRI